MDDSDSAAADFGTQLLRRRSASDLTQEELSTRSGVSVRAISDMERGRVRGPQRRTVELLADALELDGTARAELLRTAYRGRARSVVASSSVANLTTALWQLPPDIESFCGRDREVAQVRRAIETAPAVRRRSASVIFVSGQPGVGKTTLAIRAAHDVASRFPDGRFFISLRGMEPRPADAPSVCASLLRSLGVGDQQIPPSLDERVGLFRSLTHERRVLLVLDNAHDEAQVRPLLPSGPGCAALVTSRRTLVGLDGNTRILLDIVDSDSARELLGNIVGQARLAAAPAEVDEVITLCGHLPLALRVVGSQLVGRPHWSFARLAARLRDEYDRLSALSIGDVSVRSAYEISYQSLSADAQRLFRRICLVAGSEFTADVGQVLLDSESLPATLALDELTDSSLVDVRANSRYGVHDLARVFSRSQLSEYDADEAERLQLRVDDWFLDLAVVAGLALFPEYSSDRPDAMTRDQAFAVLDSEADNYLPALRRAASAGRHEKVFEFIHAMHWYSDAAAWRWPWSEIFHLGVTTARAAGDKDAELTCLSFYGWALYGCDRLFDQAAAALDEAVRLADQLGDRSQRAWSLSYLGSTEAQRGNPERAAMLLEEAATIFHALGDALGERTCRNRLGRFLYQSGQFSAAAAVLRSVPHRGDGRSAEPADMIGAFSLFYLGQTLAAMGEWQAAVDVSQQAHESMSAWGYSVLAGGALAEKGSYLRRLGRLSEARTALEDALRIVIQQSDRVTQARVLNELAALAQSAGDNATAAQRSQEAAEITTQLSSMPRET